jgi:uncharacterized protein YPO0396
MSEDELEDIFSRQIYGHFKFTEEDRLSELAKRFHEGARRMSQEQIGELIELTVKDRVKALEKQIESMKCCMNCADWDEEEMFCIRDFPPFDRETCDSNGVFNKGRPVGDKWRLRDEN